MRITSPPPLILANYRFRTNSGYGVGILHVEDGYSPPSNFGDINSFLLIYVSKKAPQNGDTDSLFLI